MTSFDRMLKAAVRRKFDMIEAWSVDRLGRSLQDLVAFLSELKSAGVDLFLHQQALPPIRAMRRRPYTRQSRPPAI
jgi:DNA invertase Pin-like site-specific DNA recombinase